MIGRFLESRLIPASINYAALLGDSTFWDSLWFTTKYTILVTPAIFICAYILAQLVNSKLQWVGLFRTIYFLPVVIGLGTSSLLWVWLFNDQVGFLNFILSHLALIKEPVLTTPSTSLAGVIVMNEFWAALIYMTDADK